LRAPSVANASSIAVIFFTSGFAALLYQVIWQRLLVLFSGADLYSVTIIVASFMAAWASASSGRARRRPRDASCCAALLRGRRARDCALRFFSRPLYYDFLYNRVGDTQIGAAAQALLLFASLLWPTFFMGASLPLLSRALASRIERASTVIGVLYGVNTLGAATGALLSTWVFLPRLGLEGASASAWCSTSPAPSFCFLPWRSFRDRASRPQSRPPPGRPATSRRFRSLSGRHLRLFRPARAVARNRLVPGARSDHEGNAFTFGTMLGVYLTGLGSGHWLAARCRRVSQGRHRVPVAAGGRRRGRDAAADRVHQVR